MSEQLQLKGCSVYFFFIITARIKICSTDSTVDFSLPFVIKNAESQLPVFSG